MCPARSSNNSKRGYLIPIGGAEEKDDNPVILQKFVDLCGGSKGKIIVIPTASKLSQTGSHYAEIFDELGAGDVHYIHVENRDDYNKEELLVKLEGPRVFLSQVVINFDFPLF